MGKSVDGAVWKENVNYLEDADKEEQEAIRKKSIKQKFDANDYEAFYEYLWKLRDGDTDFHKNSQITMKGVNKNVVDMVEDKNIKILDVGCGDGFVVSHFPNGVGVDVSHTALDRAKRFGVKNKLVKANAVNMPFKDSEFEAAICLEVIEHLTKEDGVKLLKEVQRVVKPNGLLIYSTPIRFDTIPEKMKVVATEIGKYTKSHKYEYGFNEFPKVLAPYIKLKERLRGGKYKRMIKTMLSVPHFRQFIVGTNKK